MFLNILRTSASNVLKCSLVVGEQSHKITGSITVTGVTAQMNPLQMNPHGLLVLVSMILPGFTGTRASEQHFGQMNPLKFYSRSFLNSLRISAFQSVEKGETSGEAAKTSR